METIEHSIHEKSKHLFSEVLELPRGFINTRPEIFQGRDTKYAEETVDKIVREGFDKSREPIVVWQASDGKYIVISGHSRWEASERLYSAGDHTLLYMPVKIFQGDQDDATDYALLESNREVTQEGLKSDLKAYKRAKERGYNKEHLKGIFKPESRLRLLEDVSYLDEGGSFLNYLGSSSEKSLPYLQRNAQWVGLIRREIPTLTDGHEEEMFRYLYGLGEDTAQAGKKKITISKDQFFELINQKVGRLDFEPQHALNLDERVSTSALTDPAKEEIKNIQSEIDKLVNERAKKDLLIASAISEGKNDLVPVFKQRQSDINQLITRKILEKQKIEQEIGKMERTALDLFSDADSISRENQEPELANDSSSPSPIQHQPKNTAQTMYESPEEKAFIGHNDITDAEYVYDMRQVDYQKIKSVERSGMPHLLDEKDAKEHEKIVEWAINEGKDIPGEVLADYPHLQNASAVPGDGDTKETPALPDAVVSIATHEKNLLIGNTWFTEHPEKILGEEYQTTDRFNKKITNVRGDTNDIMEGIDVPAINLPDDFEDPLQTDVKSPLQDLLSDPVKKQNMNEVIESTLKEHGNKAMRKIKGETEKYEDGCPEEYFCFDEILKEYNKGISEAEMQVWVWYKRKSGGLNDETVILNKKNGWSNYVIPLTRIDEYIGEWIKTGIICYHEGGYLPSVLYYAENIYQRQKSLENEKDELIKEYGQEQYDRQWTGLENIKHPKLTLTDSVLNNRLFIKPDSAFANDIYISELIDGTKFATVPNKEEPSPKEGILLVNAFKEWLNELPKEEFKKSTAHNIIQNYLEKKSPPRYFGDEQRLRVKQNAKKEGDALFVRFLAEALLPEDKAMIEGQWNETYNAYVEINYFKIPVAFTCSNSFKNKPLFIRAAQREGIGFINVHGSGCIAYDVGVGKTMTAILSLAQALEMGQCKRPLIVVPNQTYTNWLNELRGTVENGKVVLTGILPQYEIIDLFNLSADYLDQLKNDDGSFRMVPERSITLMTYEGFNRLSFSDKTWNEIGSELFDILNQGVNEMREQEKLFEKIKELMGKGIRGGIVDVEELGSDYLVIDEAHAMKKSFTRVKGEMQKGERKKPSYDLSSGEPSMTALRGFMISQYILRENNMRNVQLLTATPFTNSPLEIYSILALIGYQQLKKWGIQNLKDFFDTFIKTSIELVINSKLQPERKEIVLGFNNLIALQQLVFKFITYKTGEEARIQRPNKIVLPLLNYKEGEKIIPLPAKEQISTNLPMTAEQKDFMADIEKYITGDGIENFCVNKDGHEEDPANEGTKGTVLNEKKLSKDDMENARVLRGLSFARQIALSPFLYACNPKHNPTYKQYIETSPKLSYVMQCIRSVKDYHEKKKELVSGQVIYMNAGVHFFPLIKDYLVKEVGYDDKEVGIISSAISRSKKEGIKDQFQAGSVKIIIGSASIKEGINLQNHTSVLYNCWLDWNPTDVKQLEGRVWRFGNVYANVRVVNPLVEDSIDMFIFQKLEEKTSRINEIWFRAGKVNALNLEDFNPGELKMGLVTNPKVLAALLVMEERERMADDIADILNQKAHIQRIHEQRTAFNANIDHFRKIADQYRPPREQGKERATETILKIFAEFIDDESTRSTYKDESIYNRVRTAYYGMERGLQEILRPRGLTIDFDQTKLFSRMEREVKEIEAQKEERTGSHAIEARAEEIVEERILKGYQKKTVEERVKEFSKMNPKYLSELMVYDTTEESIQKQIALQEHGLALEESSDTIDELEALVKDMEEMDSILTELEKLTNAA